MKRDRKTVRDGNGISFAWYGVRWGDSPGIFRCRRRNCGRQVSGSRARPACVNIHSNPFAFVSNLFHLFKCSMTSHSCLNFSDFNPLELCNNGALFPVTPTLFLPCLTSYTHFRSQPGRVCPQPAPALSSTRGGLRESPA